MGCSKLIVMPHKLFTRSVISIIALAGALLISTSAFAVNYPIQGSSGWKQTQATPRSENHSQETTCKAKETLINNVLNKTISRVNTLLNKFDSITNRVKDYYTNKVIPSGRTVSNYESLVADIEDKKAKAEDLLAGAKADIEAFSCESSDPKGQINQIREDIKNLKKGGRQYKESIKTLIKAILSQEKASPNPSLSPNPSIIPCRPSPAACPQNMPPAPDFCKDGKIVPGKKNECGCQMGFDCEKNSASDRGNESGRRSWSPEGDNNE